MNGSPTAAQKRFHDWCRAYGCIVSWNRCDAIHHIKGSRMKLKGCKNPGEWYILPLMYEYHQGCLGVHTNKRGFEEATLGTEKEHWVRLIEAYEFEHGSKPMSEEEYQIIFERA